MAHARTDDSVQLLRSLEQGQRIIAAVDADVGSNLAVRFREVMPHTQVVAFDNLMRRGSELNLPRLRENGVEFVKCDVRQGREILDVGRCDMIIDCAAEPGAARS